MSEHFPDCHPEDGEDRREVPDGYQPAETENCWHWWAWMTGINLTTMFGAEAGSDEQPE